MAPFEYRAIEELLILSKSGLQGTHQADLLDAFYNLRTQEAVYPAPTFRGLARGSSTRARITSSTTSWARASR